MSRSVTLCHTASLSATLGQTLPYFITTGITRPHFINLGHTWPHFVKLDHSRPHSAPLGTLNHSRPHSVALGHSRPQSAPVGREAAALTSLGEGTGWRMQSSQHLQMSASSTWPGALWPRRWMARRRSWQYISSRNDRNAIRRGRPPPTIVPSSCKRYTVSLIRSPRV